MKFSRVSLLLLEKSADATFHLDQTLAMADFTIDNDGSLAQFHNAIEQALGPLLRNA